MDTDSQKLKDYIFRQLQSGVHPDEIANQLRSAGWSEASINQAFNQVQSSIMPHQPDAEQSTAKQISDPAVATEGHGTVQNDTRSPHVPPSEDSRSAQTQYRADGRRRGRIKTAWILMKQSLKVIMGNKTLFRYPLMSLIFVIILTVLTVIAFSTDPELFIDESTTATGDEADFTTIGYLVFLLYYLLCSFVVFYYNSGLAAHTLDIFRGQSQGYSNYMRHARSRGLTILFFSAITVTVGMLLRALERQRLIGLIVSRVIGILWNFANLFTIPIIVETDQSAPKAIKSSTQLFISRWGENIAARIGFGGIAFLVYVVIAITIGVPLLVLAGFLGEVAAGIVVLVIFPLLILLLAIIEIAVSQVLNIALYYYARYEQVPAAFSADLLNSVFIPKKSKKNKKKHSSA